MYYCVYIYIYIYIYIYTVVRKFFYRKYFFDKKIQGKIFSLMHDFLEIFYLEHISLAIIRIYAR